MEPQQAPQALPPPLAAPAAAAAATATAAPSGAPALRFAQAPAGAAEAQGGGGAYEESALRAGFEHALLAFWRSRGYPTVPPCSMNWLRLALVPWDLWSRVQRYGGYEEVTSRKLWRTVGSSFGPPESCTTISYQTKLAYTTVLLPFELETGRMHAPQRDDAVPWGKGGVAAGAGGVPRAPRPKHKKKPRMALARGWASSDDASSGDDGGGVFGSRRRRRGGALGPGGPAGSSSRSRSPTPAEEEWALCDACRKWRRLPRGVRGAALPDRWTCERGTWGFRDAAAGGAFTPLSCALPEPASSGEGEVPPEDGAPDALLWEGEYWIFAYSTAEAALRRTHGVGQPQRPRALAAGDAAESAPPPPPPPPQPQPQQQQQQQGGQADEPEAAAGDDHVMLIE